ncbi:hypothetical protein AAG570_012907 [Ranatra chinensis]|uniref:PDZ domain-containing protein n=1 Tax=Ranatra chinensis TaxID=642074 RepID=A0ABD0YF81_9HEMI
MCHIFKWDTFEGYGFNLHAEKGKPGQYVGKVDPGSPAQAAGLREGDRIVEVNGVNIANENHKQVVQRIRASPDETRLLVIDPEGDAYFKSHNVVVALLNDTASENSLQDEDGKERNALNLNMTAKELRAQLAARKKYDPKKDHSIDFKKKYDIVQKL